MKFANARLDRDVLRLAAVVAIRETAHEGSLRSRFLVDSGRRRWAQRHQFFYLEWHYWPGDAGRANTSGCMAVFGALAGTTVMYTVFLPITSR
jgi:hypothetical protein